MSSTTRHGNKHAKAIKRRRLHAKERHKQQQRQAQRDIEALSQALHDVVKWLYSSGHTEPRAIVTLERCVR
jgi:hypothetical protein